MRLLMHSLLLRCAGFCREVIFCRQCKNIDNKNEPMSNGISFSLGASYVQRALNHNSNNLGVSVERLSSGKRINSSADDAAGLAVVSHIETGLRAGNQIYKNILNGISYLEIAEQVLAEVTSNLQRFRGLLVQAGNGVQSLDILMPELDAILTEVDRVLVDTKIFGKKPFSEPAIDIVIGVDIEHPPSMYPSDYIPPSSSGLSILILSEVLNGEGNVASASSGLWPLALITEGSSNVRFEIDAGEDNDEIQLFTRDGKHLGGTHLANEYDIDEHGDFILDENGDKILLNSGGQFWSSLGVNSPEYLVVESKGFNADAVYSNDSMVDSLTSSAGGNISFTTGPGNSRSVTIGNADEDIMVMVTGNSHFMMRGSWDALVMPTTAITEWTDEYKAWLTEYDELWNEEYRMEKASIRVGDDSGEYITINRTPLDRHELGLNKVWLVTADSISQSLAYADEAIAKLTKARVYYGAVQSRLGSVLQFRSEYDAAMVARKSRIEDADYARETAVMTKAQILRQAGSAMVAQANNSRQQVLRLL